MTETVFETKDEQCTPHVIRGILSYYFEMRDHAVGRGATAFNLFDVGRPASYTDAQISSILTRIDAVWGAYKDAGVADKAYIFGFDGKQSTKGRVTA